MMGGFIEAVARSYNNNLALVFTNYHSYTAKAHKPL
jgi:hypothetical protein